MTIAVAPNTSVRVLTQMGRNSGTGLAVTEQLREADVDGIPEKLKVAHEDRPRDASFESVDIPSIDLSLIETDRAQLVRDIGEASRQWGIFRIFNHGIPADLMKTLEIHGLSFFGQSDEEKSKLLNIESGSGYYTGNNAEEKRHSLHWAESFVMFLNQWNTLDAEVIKHATRDWATADSEFRDAFLKYLMGIRSATEMVLQLAAESLGLEKDFYSSRTVETGTIGSRWNYYPACPLPSDVLGAHRHTDPNLLTLIQQDKVAGLQVEKDGHWYSVKPVEGCLVVNISDTFQIWTNGIFKSVLHRVLVNKDVSRFSIAWVISPDQGQSLCAASELVDANHPRLYRDVTAREYQKQIIEARKSSKDSKVFNGYNQIETLKL